MYPLNIRTSVITLLLSLCLDHLVVASAVPVFARATSYHRTEKGCDPDTKRGLTSTRIVLKDSSTRTIGMVAVDPKQIPYGSLVYSPGTNRFFLACDIGGAVFNRTAAKRLAKRRGLSKKYSDALVLDFYARKEILRNEFGDFYVIKHEGSNFKKLSSKSQKLRLKPSFWLEKIKSKKKDSTIKEIKKSLQTIS